MLACLTQKLPQRSITCTSQRHVLTTEILGELFFRPYYLATKNKSRSLLSFLNLDLKHSSSAKDS